MVKDTKLYDLLGVGTSADDNELKKGYRKAALKYHPDKPTGNTEKFKEISEAFDILSNKEKRELYDNYGLEAARRGMPDFGGAGAGGDASGGNPFAGFNGAGGGGGAGGPRTFHFSTGMPGGGSGGNFQSFSADDAFNIFRNFGASGGFEGEDDIFSQMFGGGGARSRAPRGGFSNGGFSMGGGMPGGGGGMPGGIPGMHGMSSSPPPPAAGPKSSFQIKLPVSLKDLALGATKKMKITRRRSGGQEEKILNIQIKPGWKAGTKITYANEGDLQPDGSLQDVVFVVEEKPDVVFSRTGDDLEQTVELSLKEALCGFDKVVETIEGKRIRVSNSRPVQPGQTVKYPNLGMPISKKPGQKGELVIKFKVRFPEQLTAEQRQFIEANF